MVVHADLRQCDPMVTEKLHGCLESGGGVFVPEAL